MIRDVRLGDDIDDYCVRCKRVMNHAVVSVLNGVAAKVRCRTCHNDHDFRHEQPPPPKVDSRKAALFNEVLKTVDPAAAGAALDGEPAELEAAGLAPGELEAEVEAEAEAAEPEAAEAEPEAMAASEPARAPAKATKPAAKAAKGKSKAKK